jgi:hypothetical protein
MSRPDRIEPLHRQSERGQKLVYEVVCTYEVEADSKAAAGRVASSVAESLARTGVTRSSGVDGTATLLKTTARFKRVA